MVNKEKKFDEYGIAIVIGLLCAMVCFLFSIYPGPYIYVPLALLLGSFAMLLSYLSPDNRWFTWLWLTLPYVGLTLWIVISIKNYRAKYEGVYFRTEIYWSAIYLFVCPVIASLLGPLLGKRRLISFVVGLIAVLGIGVYCQMYITRKSHIIVSTNNSIDIADNVSRLRIDFGCRYSKSIDYMRFAYFEDGGGCGGSSRVTVISKSPMAELTRDAVWLIDSAEKNVQMRPRPYGDDVAIVGDFAPHQYDSVPGWSTDIPIFAIAKAHEVRLRWGDIQIQLQPDHIQNFKQHVMEYRERLRI